MYEEPDGTNSKTVPQPTPLQPAPPMATVPNSFPCRSRSTGAWRRAPSVTTPVGDHVSTRFRSVVSGSKCVENGLGVTRAVAAELEDEAVTVRATEHRRAVEHSAPCRRSLQRAACTVEPGETVEHSLSCALS